MGMRQINDQATRNVTQNNSGTYAISLPIGFMRVLGWRKGQKLTVKRRGDKIIIEDWKPD